MKIRFVTAFFFLFISICNVYCQDNPESCAKEVTSFANDRGEVVAKCKVAKEYYMTAPASDEVGHTFDQRTANLRAKITAYFEQYVNMRREKYRLTTCTFYKTKSATTSHGRIRKKEEINIASMFEFIPSTLEHTTNGDMKVGPNIDGNKIWWVTGTNSGRSWTFVRISSKYTNDYIQLSIEKEIADIKLELNNFGIPTD